MVEGAAGDGRRLTTSIRHLGHCLRVCVCVGGTQSVTQ